MTRLIRPHLLSLAVAICLWPASSAGQELRTISSIELLQRASEDPARARAIEAQIAAARAERRAAALWTNPTLAYDREEIFIAGDGQPEDFLRLTVPIEISGRRSRAVDAAEAEIEATKADAAATRFELELAMLEIYTDAAHARHLARVLADDVAVLGELVTAAGARTKAGEASGHDLARLEIERDATEDLRAEAEELLDRARRRLAIAAGEPRARFDAAEDLALSGEPAPVELLLSRAQETRGDLRAARLRSMAAEHARAAAGWSWLPALMLTGGIKSADVGTERALGYVAGVAVDLPLFDRGGAASDRARAAQQRFGAEVDLIVRRLSAEVESARATLVSRRTRAEKIERTTLPKARALLSSAQAAYREGERPVFELLDAQRAARETQLRAIALLRDVRLAELELWRAIGTREVGKAAP